MPEGKKNVYVCGRCGWKLVTVDVDDGTTPAMTDCGKCNGVAESSMYHVDQTLEPTHEWYSPDVDELCQLLRDGRRATFVHTKKGGLLLREITKL